MGTGKSGRYYTSHGSRTVHHNAIIHSLEGSYTSGNRLKSGGHGQDAIDYLDKNGIKYNIVKTYPNGVRVGNVPDHKDKKKKSGTGQVWFPKNWTQKDIVAAGEHVVGLKSNSHAKDGTKVFGKWKGVQVGVIKTNGNIATVFPTYNQPGTKKKGGKK